MIEDIKTDQYEVKAWYLHDISLIVFDCKAATIKLIVSHDFAMVKPTLPPGIKKR